MSIRFVIVTLLAIHSMIANAREIDIPLSDIPLSEELLAPEIEAETPAIPEGTEGIQTLAGIDADQDGIRDDIENLILSEHPGEANVLIRNSLYNIAKFFHKIFIDTDLNPNTSMYFSSNYLIPHQCLKRDFAIQADAINAATKIKANILNSMLRIDRYYSIIDPLEKEFARSSSRVSQRKKNDGDSKFCAGGDARSDISLDF